MGEGFGPLIQMYPYSVQADLISMKPEPIHYVCSDGAQADTHVSIGPVFLCILKLYAKK